METATKTAEQVAQEYDLDEDAFVVYCDYVMTADPEDNVSSFQDTYIGQMTVVEYAEQLVDDLYGSKDDFLLTYFDYDKFARDLELGGDVWEQAGYLFRSY